jgi:hypothetical protein
MLDINGYVCLNFAVVPDGILGFEFQRTQDCTINVAKGSILIHGHKVSLQFENDLIKSTVGNKIILGLMKMSAFEWSMTRGYKTPASG